MEVLNFFHPIGVIHLCLLFRYGETANGRIPVADMLFLGVHHDLGEHDTGVSAGHQLRGDTGDADVHHWLVEHAGAVRHRRVQAIRAQRNAEPDAPRVLAR